MRKGSKCSDETRRKMSESRIRSGNPCFGKYGKDHPAYGKLKNEEAKELMRLSKTGEKNPNYKPKLTLNCCICNKEFQVIPSRKNAKCCSRECYNEYRLDKPLYPSIFDLCGCGCNEIVYGGKKYIKGHTWINRRHKDIVKQKMKDNHADFALDKHPNWQNGKSFEPYCEKFNEKKKEEVREQYGRKCYLCGKDEKDNLTKRGKMWKLSVHHIDNDKGQGCNGKPWKLVPLCLKCHNSNKVKNIKNY